MANKYIVNSNPTVACQFKVLGVLTDPTTVKLRVVDPEGVESISWYHLAGLTKDAVGKYSKTFQVPKLGTWFYEWTGTGACIAVSQKYFQVVTYME